MQKFLINILLFLSIFSVSFSQNISNSQTEITENDSTFSIFDNFYLSENINKQKDIINHLEKKINIYQQKVTHSYSQINNLNKQILAYSKIYAKTLKSYYLLKNNLTSTLVFFLSADSFNQTYERFSYLKLLISYIQTVHNYLNILKLELKTNKKILLKYKIVLNKYLASMQSKKSTLDSNFIILLKQTSILQQKSIQIRISINNTYKGFEMIQKSIKNIHSNEQYNNSSIFTVKCNPLLDCSIISSFGVHSHPYLKNVKLRNDGLDLYSKIDTFPKAVADGIVVKILKIPNFGYSVIIKHNQFFSVYSNLKQVYVKQADTLNYGHVLGYISKSTSRYSFPCLNFQIWKQSTKLNPKAFLNIK